MLFRSDLRSETLESVLGGDEQSEVNLSKGREVSASPNGGVRRRTYAESDDRDEERKEGQEGSKDSEDHVRSKGEEERKQAESGGDGVQNQGCEGAASVDVLAVSGRTGADHKSVRGQQLPLLVR